MRASDEAVPETDRAMSLSPRPGEVSPNGKISQLPFLIYHSQRTDGDDHQSTSHFLKTFHKISNGNQTQHNKFPLNLFF